MGWSIELIFYSGSLIFRQLTWRRYSSQPSINADELPLHFKTPFSLAHSYPAERPEFGRKGFPIWQRLFCSGLSALSADAVWVPNWMKDRQRRNFRCFISQRIGSADQNFNTKFTRICINWRNGEIPKDFSLTFNLSRQCPVCALARPNFAMDIRFGNAEGQLRWLPWGSRIKKNC